MHLALTTHDAGGLTAARPGAGRRRSTGCGPRGVGTERQPRSCSSSASRRRATTSSGDPDRRGVVGHRAVALARWANSATMWAGSAEKISSMSSSRLATASGYFDQQLGPQPCHGRSAERVVGHDGLLAHPEERQHERGEQAGAVLAGRAVEDRRAARRARPARSSTATIWRPASLEHLLVLGAEEARAALELLGVGQLLDEGEVVERRPGARRHRSGSVRAPGRSAGRSPCGCPSWRMTSRSGSVSSPRPSARNSTRQRVRWPSAVA